MRSFLRNNMAVVIGISLPIVVMIFFVLASRVPRAFVEPPQHDLLLMGQTGQYDTRPVRIDVTVDAGRLRVRLYKVDYADNPALAYSNVAPRLFLWSHETQTIREIPLNLPDDIDAVENGDELTIAELAGRRITADFRSPDGYEFRLGSYDRGFFGLFFDGGSSRPMIAKDGATHVLQVPAGVPYWNVQFLAWVVE